jgi:mRNA-degrading endonuclease toxin of MazEF toxin-antitoxin module
VPKVLRTWKIESFIVQIRYHRGQLIRISVEESVRLEVPKDRFWLIVQSDEVRDSREVVVCYLTSAVNEQGRPKRPLTTDARIKKGTDLGEQTLRADSFVRCGKIYSAKISEIRGYEGMLPNSYMILVDKKLRLCLGLDTLAKLAASKTARSKKKD